MQTQPQVAVSVLVVAEVVAEDGDDKDQSKREVKQMDKLTFGEILVINLLFFLLSFIVPVIFFYSGILNAIVATIISIIVVVCWVVALVILEKKGVIKRGGH